MFLLWEGGGGALQHKNRERENKMRTLRTNLQPFNCKKIDDEHMDGWIPLQVCTGLNSGNGRNPRIE